MGQAERPKNKRTNRKVVVEQIISGGGSGIKDENPTLINCFQFQLEEPTKLVKEIEIGTQVFGDFSNERIIILASIGALGFVPKPITKKIISLATSKQVSIQGAVIEKIVTENAVVEICL